MAKKAPSKKLWSSGTKELDHIHATLAQQYTVGNDWALDALLVPYDLEGSLAHAVMLEKIGILTKKELAQIKKGLQDIFALWEKGKWEISPDQEDGHTAIEAYLTEKYGDVGKKIHTGRSRNDQVLTVMRLYQRDTLVSAGTFTEDLSVTLADKANTWAKIPMPGYTHLQRAMPTTAGTWLGSFAIALEECLPAIETLYNTLDQSPLGSAAGFGIKGLKLNRKLTAKEMGFSRVQENPIYCAYSRGEFELRVLEVLSPVMRTIGKLANELLLFTSVEFGFFTVSRDFTTGSSVMPQKCNQDVLELVRGSVGMFIGYRSQVENIILNKPSGYNRDFQLTKDPFMRAMDLVEGTLAVVEPLISTLEPVREKLQAAMTPELYATDEALTLVKSGVPFRDAYKQVKKKFFT